jgi:hypothetical protein
MALGKYVDLELVLIDRAAEPPLTDGSIKERHGSQNE